MHRTIPGLALAAMLVLWPAPGGAQSADEVVEKYLAASGGREALTNLTSRVSLGTIAITTPIGELKGTIEVYNKAPNKSRTLVKLDMSAVGGGQIVNDQRFDGTSGYLIDTFNGNREVTGEQLELMRAASFPTPLLRYKENGATLALSGREKNGERDAFVVVLTPKVGPPMRVFIDAESFMLLKTIITVTVPQLGGPIDQVIEFSDFRDVNGVKTPHVTRSSNPVQTITATVTEMRHNTEIDDAMFSKPSAQ